MTRERHSVGRCRTEFVGANEGILKVNQSIVETERTLGEPETRALVGECGVPINKWTVASSRAEAVKSAEAIGFPVVLKTASSQIVHKSDVGCVELRITGVSEVKRAYDRVVANAAEAGAADPHRVTVQETIRGKLELIVGLQWSEVFGHVILAGSGGIWVEVYDDVAFRLCPVTRDDVEAMLNELRSAAILHGIRRSGIEFDRVVDFVLTVSRIVERYPNLRSLDLNPVMVGSSPHQAVAVDALATLALKD